MCPPLLRVEAPKTRHHAGFVAGIIPKDQAAPILRWMIEKGWDEARIRAYCERRGWQVTTVH